MSGVLPTTASSAPTSTNNSSLANSSQSSTQTLGYNAPPVSFAGIASGINYTQIINSVTNQIMQPATLAQDQIKQLNAQNTELVKINGMLLSVQNTLTALQAPTNFTTYDAGSSNTQVATGTGTGSTATPGNYIVTVNSLATATQVLAASSAYGGLNPGDNFSDPNGGYAVTLNTGTTGQGLFTIDGVQIAYNSGESLNSFISTVNDNSQLSALGVMASVSAAGVFSLTSGDQPLSLGSPSDNGNIEQVLKIDTAQIVNGASSGFVTGTSSVNGINATNDLDQANTTTAVTSGSFTINGVAIAVNAQTQSLNDIITEIDGSNAGVIATYDADTNSLTLTNQNLGPQSIVLGAPGDSSNFLTAMGLVGPGSTTTVGSQSSVTVTNPFGVTNTIYSAGNTLSTAIQGINLTLTGTGTTNVSVTQDTSVLINSINNFVSAYNTAINEIDKATSAPVVNSQGNPQTNAGAPQTAAQQSAVLSPGGILYSDVSVYAMKDQLVSLVSQLFQTGSSNYNSLPSIGLQLDSTVSQLAQQNNTSASSNGGTTSGNANTAYSQQGGLTTATFDGTTGAFAALNVSQFASAFAADSTAVSNMLSGSNGLAAQLGSYLTYVTGAPTQLSTGFVGTIPATPLLQGEQTSNDSLVSSLQQQIAVITDEANLQADSLRSQFVNSEGLISGYQSIQSQIANLFKG